MDIIIVGHWLGKEDQGELPALPIVIWGEGDNWIVGITVIIESNIVNIPLQLPNNLTLTREDAEAAAKLLLTGFQSLGEFYAEAFNKARVEEVNVSKEHSPVTTNQPSNKQDSSWLSKNLNPAANKIDGIH